MHHRSLGWSLDIAAATAAAAAVALAISWWPLSACQSVAVVQRRWSNLLRPHPTDRFIAVTPVRDGR